MHDDEVDDELFTSDERTWCADKINEHDIEYVRPVDVEGLIEKIRKHHEKQTGGGYPVGFNDGIGTAVQEIRSHFNTGEDDGNT